MSRRRSLLIALVVLAALLLAWWRWPRGDGGGEAAGPVAAARAPARAPTARLTEYAAARLGGRVVADEDGAPIAGATVALQPLALDFGARRSAGQDFEPIALITDARGGFALDAVPPGRWSATATATGRLPASLDGVVLGPGAARGDLVLRLARGGSRLSGTVSDIGGGPVPGARIALVRMSEITIGGLFRAPLTTRSDDAGRYAIDLADGTYVVEVGHVDYAEDRDAVVVRGPTTRDFTLTPGSAVEGVVLLRGEERPVPGAMVTPMPAGGDAGFVLTGTTITGGAIADGEGRFVLRGLPPGPVDLRAVAPGAASSEATSLTLAIGEQRADVAVYVEKAVTVSGKVVAKGSGAPLPGVLVGLYALSPGTANLAADPTGEQGEFAIHGVRPGSFTLAGALDGHLPNAFGPSITVADRDVADLVLELDAGATLRGRVEPPTPAAVGLEYVGEVGFGTIMHAVGAGFVNARVAADGSFVLRGVPSGKLALRAAAADGRGGQLELEVTGDRDGLVVPLGVRGVVAGIVVTPDDRPVADVQVRVESTTRSGRVAMDFGGGRGGQGARTGADGRFEVRGLDDGRHEVSVHDDGVLAFAMKGQEPRAPIPVTVRAAAPGAELRLVVEARGEVLRGTVVAGGAPVADAWVRATYLDGDAPAGESAEDQRRRRRWAPSEDPVLSGADGRFEVRGLRAGRYDLSAERSGDGQRGQLTSVASGSTVTIALQPLATLTGRVRTPVGPATAFSVELDGPGPRRAQFSGPEGRYRMPRIEPGSYKVTVTASGGRAAGTVELAPGQEATLDLAIVGFGSVTGRLVDLKGAPLAAMPVWAQSTDETGEVGRKVMEAMRDQGPRTDADGRFQVGGLGVGRGVLIAFEVGRLDPVAYHEFVLAEGQTLDLGTITGQTTAKLPDDQRGTLGLTVDDATFARRPGARAGEALPAGLEAETDYLWIEVVSAGGAAASAGLVVGDRVTAIDGVAVGADGLPALVAGRRLADDAVALDATVTVTVARGVTVALKATARPSP